jgi:hypothetical protein
MKRAFPTPLLLALLLSVQASAHEPVPGRPVDPNAPAATVSVTRGGTGQPSLVEVRLEPQSANGSGELFLSLSQNGQYKRRVLQPSTPGVYRLRYAFPTAGNWNVYLRYGAGQAGLVAWTEVSVPPPAGREVATARFEDGYARDVPGYVQPLGYAAFGLLMVLALLGVGYLLNRIRHAPASVPLTPARQP